MCHELIKPVYFKPENDSMYDTVFADKIFPGLGCSDSGAILWTTSIVPVFLDNSQTGPLDMVLAFEPS